MKKYREESLIKLSDSKFILQLYSKEIPPCCKVMCSKCKNLYWLNQKQTQHIFPDDFIDCYTNYMDKLKLKKLQRILK
jgi:hypothetical protein